MLTRRNILKRLAGAVAVAFTGIVGAVERAKGEPRNLVMEAWEESAPSQEAKGPWTAWTLHGFGDPMTVNLASNERLILSRLGTTVEAAARSPSGRSRLLARAEDVTGVRDLYISATWNAGGIRPYSIRNYLDAKRAALADPGQEYADQFWKVP